MMPLASTHDYQLYVTSFIRVTELLDEPKDTRAAAQAFIEELTEDYEGRLDDSITVISASDITDTDCEREEIEYVFMVLASPHDVQYINGQDDGYEFLEVAQ